MSAANEKHAAAPEDPLDTALKAIIAAPDAKEILDNEWKTRKLDDLDMMFRVAKNLPKCRPTVSFSDKINCSEYANAIFHAIKKKGYYVAFKNNLPSGPIEFIYGVGVCTISSGWNYFQIDKTKS